MRMASEELAEMSDCWKTHDSPLTVTNKRYTTHLTLYTEATGEWRKVSQI